MQFCTADTTLGKIRGLISSGVRIFRGVPYAASTAGANRFRRPQPRAPWSGTRDCLGHGQVSPQLPYNRQDDYARLIQFDLNVAFGGAGEDCLHLSLWTPDVESAEKRPVLVSIHGGGFAIGSGNHPMYDGAELASFGNAVVVSVTHRLSSFGYLNLADIDPSGSWSDAGVAGILDLIAALEWVRDNVGNFGGDPGCVTVFGQSGGGWKVSTLLGMPAARGLFHRAMVQSGSLTSHMPREAAAAVAQAFVQRLGLNGTRLGEIRSLPWSVLLEAQTAVGPPAFAPFVDGVHIPADPLTDATMALHDEVPLIVSTTLDDAGLFFNQFGLEEAGLLKLLGVRLGDKAQSTLQLYRKYHPHKSPYLLHAQLVTDAGFRRFAHSQAEAKSVRGKASVYQYLWQWVCPAADGKFGAVHAMDVSATFRNARDAILGAGSEEALAMCHAMSSVLIAFARTGDPNNAAIPHWPVFELASRATLVFNRNLQVEADPYGEIREFWTKMPPAQSVLG